MSRPLLFQCIVLPGGGQDPLMLGRVRGRLITDNYEDVINGFDNPPWNEETDPWSDKDPFVFTPLLPYFIYQTPKENELIQVFYVNRDFKYKNQYYVQNNFYAPNSVLYQDNQGANKFTGVGLQISNPKDIKSKKTGQYLNELSKGVYVEPGDNALIGRGSADVIVKPEEVLLRAGKFEGTLQTNQTLIANDKRAYLQLSNFQSSISVGNEKKTTTIEEAVLSVKYLIEWVITNPENTQNKFCGEVYLYQIPADVSTNTKNISQSTIIKNKKLVAKETFALSTKEQTIAFINQFIQDCNSQTQTKRGTKLFTAVTERFPIFYRPSEFTYNLIEQGTAANISLSAQTTGTTNCPTGPIPGVEFTNLTAIYRGIKLNPALKQGGYGLIYVKDKVGKPQNLVTSISNDYIASTIPTTVSALGADKVFLLSNKTNKINTPGINFKGTVYGIPSSGFTGEILEKTSSMVRGEELMELINLIVRFLVTHTHAYPGLPPVPVTQDGTNVTDILTELQEAANKILNEYIRLN